MRNFLQKTGSQEFYTQQESMQNHRLQERFLHYLDDNITVGNIDHDPELTQDLALQHRDALRYIQKNTMREYLFDRLIEAVMQDFIYYKILKGIKQNKMSVKSISVQKTGIVDDHLGGTDYMISVTDKNGTVHLTGIDLILSNDVFGIEQKKQSASMPKPINEFIYNNIADQRLAKEQRNKGFTREVVVINSYLGLNIFVDCLRNIEQTGSILGSLGEKTDQNIITFFDKMLEKYSPTVQRFEKVFREKNSVPEGLMFLKNAGKILEFTTQPLVFDSAVTIVA